MQKWKYSIGYFIRQKCRVNETFSTEKSFKLTFLWLSFICLLKNLMHISLSSCFTLRFQQYVFSPELFFRYKSLEVAGVQNLPFLSTVEQ